MNKKILLVNLGSPKSLSTEDVREYLREFLSDDKVIDLPKVIQQFILKAFILPFRPAKAKKAYEKIWQDEGSPLIINTQKIAPVVRFSPNILRREVFRCEVRQSQSVVINPNASFS